MSQSHGIKGGTTAGCFRHLFLRERGVPVGENINPFYLYMLKNKYKALKGRGKKAQQVSFKSYYF